MADLRKGHEPKSTDIFPTRRIQMTAGYIEEPIKIPNILIIQGPHCIMLRCLRAADGWEKQGCHGLKRA